MTYVIKIVQIHNLQLYSLTNPNSREINFDQSILPDFIESAELHKKSVKMCNLFL